MNNRPIAISGIVLGLLGVGLVALAAFQNHTRTTQLSLDLGFAAWQLDQEIAIPTLMAICFGGGFLLATGLFFFPMTTARSRARRLEAELALTGSGGARDGWR